MAVEFPEKRPNQSIGLPLFQVGTISSVNLVRLWLNTYIKATLSPLFVFLILFIGFEYPCGSALNGYQCCVKNQVLDNRARL